MASIVTLRLSPKASQDDFSIKQHLASELKVSVSKITAFQVIKRSIDARSKNIVVNLQVKVFVEEAFEDHFSFQPQLQDVSKARQLLIVGAGPAGLYAALRCIEEGFCPVILERGKDVRARRRDLAVMNKEGVVNPESNYCFGEGGAGTYSDGKLYTRSNKRGNILKCLQWFKYFGAPQEILVESHPHIGTNKLPGIISAMREAIEACGGKVLFNAKLTDFIIEGDTIKGAVVNGAERIFSDGVILATGHSARDIFQLLYDKGIEIHAKPFALGVRIEHAQAFVDSVQYKCDISQGRGAYLPPASYSLVSQEMGKGVFSFCMCPGGIIAPASTEEGALVVNGWSPSKRDNPYANSGLVVTVDEQDFAAFGFKGPLAAMHYQKMVEEKAWTAGGGRLVAPAQRVVDFTTRTYSSTLPKCSYLPGIQSALMHEVLPQAVYNSLAAGIVSFGKKMKGYHTNEALVVATESRTSSPVRIPRDSATLMHPQIKGLFPCAEGAGYAGGIISAAIDGDNCAAAAIAYLKQFAH